MPHAWINGRLIDEDAAEISIRDGGFLHGVGVFTTMRADDRRVFRLDRHLARTRRSCDALAFPVEMDDALIREAVDDLLEKNGLVDARLRLTVTRGAPGLDGEFEPTILLTATTFEPYPPELYEAGMTAGVVDQQKANPFDIQAGHKTLNYLSRFAALREAQSRGANEALWFSITNHLQSGSISNVFIVKAGELLTPPTNDELAGDESLRKSMTYSRANVLPGITREAVIEIARSQSIGVKLAALTINDLLEADEVFLTNSAMRAMPVCRVERRAIGDEKPGEITRRLARELDAMAKE